MIPKILHFIWIGDIFKIPHECVKSWTDKNPDYKVVLWGNHELEESEWKNKSKIDDMLAKKDYAGAADIMRYEILYQHGGVYIDIDSYCIKPLEDWLLDCQAFACWEQEIIRNNLISNAYIAGVPGADVWKMCIDEIPKIDCTEKERAWLLTGPMMLTNIFFQRHPDLTVYPSHFFIQDHHTGFKTNVTGHHFANQLWGSEIGYEKMNEAMRSKNENSR